MSRNLATCIISAQALSRLCAQSAHMYIGAIHLRWRRKKNGDADFWGHGAAHGGTLQIRVRARSGTKVTASNVNDFLLLVEAVS